VSEACTNVVLHAYADREPGPFNVRAQVRGRRLEIAVCDEGHGMRPRPDSPGLGLGLPLMASATEELCIEQQGGATRVAMAFDMDEPPAIFARTG
jgi:serine/threonine-protein kinase RsbW/stage II sporulation protein AB (anti-sigma F factor)